MNNIINNQNIKMLETNTVTNKDYDENNKHTLDLQKNFLNLLITQIKNQDPIEPMKNTELTSQLAQINTVGQIEKLNNTIEQLVYQDQKNQHLRESSLIGHHILALGSELIHKKNNITKFGIALSNNAKLVNIKIKDKKNNIIFNKNIKNMKSGIHHFSWNGKDINKKDVNTGKYTIFVEAKNNNENIPANTLIKSLVKSVIVSPLNISHHPLINLGLSGTTTLSQIYEILT